MNQEKYFLVFFVGNNFALQIVLYRT